MYYPTFILAFVSAVAVLILFVILRFGSQALGWRLFLLVPLGGEAIILCSLLLSFRSSTAHLSDLLIVTIAGYVFGLTLFGWQAAILGELAWLMVRWLELPKKVPSKYAVPLGAISGATVGMFYQIASAHLLAVIGGNIWLDAYSAGGAVGGLFVAYYAEKDFGAGCVVPRFESTRWSGAERVALGCDRVAR